MVRILIRRFVCAREGATILEYAIVAPVFFLMLFAIVEYGLYTFHSVAVESAVSQAARAASIGRTGAASGACTATSDRVGYVQCILRDKTSGLINSDSVTVVANLVANGGVPASQTPDICMTDPPRAGGTCPPDTKFLDSNGNGVFDGSTGLTSTSLGNPGDLVEIRVFYPWKVQIPLMKEFFGCRGDQNQAGCQQGVAMITAATVLKNEPFGPASSSSTSSSSSGGEDTSSSSGGDTGGGDTVPSAPPAGDTGGGDTAPSAPPAGDTGGGDTAPSAPPASDTGGGDTAPSAPPASDTGGGGVTTDKGGGGHGRDSGLEAY